MECLKEKNNMPFEEQVIVEEKISANLVLAKDEKDIEDNMDELIQITQENGGERAMQNVEECFEIAQNFSKRDSLRDILILKTAEELLPLVNPSEHKSLKKLANTLEEMVDENGIDSKFGKICAQAYIKTVRKLNNIY
jgi:hypothetical protein